MKLILTGTRLISCNLIITFSCHFFRDELSHTERIALIETSENRETHLALPLNKSRDNIKNTMMQ